MSSTSSPQRCTHFTMFCAALSAPVTMCTFASSRTPDMPTGSRMPSCASMMNSCGRMCRIFWSAGIATARAASITRSTSPGVTSLSRIATMPCEFRLRTWLPAMPANTEWIWQPGHQLRFLDRALDRLHRGVDIDDHTALQPARRMRADADDLDRAVRVRARPRSPRPSTCRCRARRSDFVLVF